MTHAEGVDAIPGELLAELERLRKLEERLKSGHRQMRADAESEIARLHAALRETAGRVKERECEIERLTAELERKDGDRQPGRRTADLEQQLHAEAIRQKDEQLARTAVAPPEPPAAPARRMPSKREIELARHEEDLTRREVQLALFRRRLVAAELRLVERAWRMGPAGAPGAEVAEREAHSFAVGLRTMALTKRFVPEDGGSGSW